MILMGSDRHARPSTDSGQAPAGIQESQAEASGSSAWIPAFAGMTQARSAPQILTDWLLASQDSLAFHYKGIVRLLERGVASSAARHDPCTPVEIFLLALQRPFRRRRLDDATHV